MPFFATAYDTTAGKIAVQGKLDHALREDLIAGGLSNHCFGVQPVDERRAVFVTGCDAVEMQIPPFSHPYLIRNFKGQDYLATDVRLFRASTDTYQSDRDFEASVRNKAEYGLVKCRAVLSLLWLGSNPGQLRSRFAFAGTVFAAWLSQAIAKAYALDFQDQMRINAVGIYYYHSLFTTAHRLEGDALETAVVHTIAATKIPAAEVYKLFESIEEIKDIDDYCQEVQKAVSNVRLKTFNLVMLLTLVRNTWYGTNAKEMISVALEHPPTWIGIVYTALTERSYKSSQLYKLIEATNRRGAADEFRLNFVALFKDQVVALESAEPELVFKDFEG